MSVDSETEVPNPVVENVRAALAAAGLEDTVVVVPDSVATAAAAAAVLGCEVGAIANSLIFECGGEPLLILSSGAGKVDTKKVARDHGLPKITRATPEFVLEHAGQPVGGVAPMGHREPIRAFLDTDLEQYPVLWAGAGSHQAMLSISYRQLLQSTGATETAVR
ncbi:prolyl-tRNA editing enzyme YbaK/EbsC (Cys-tRNA(Pro) deacylase) [Arthrobacter stackebrandtii]|uniref:Prolyl-tRNA editing enzyme YbaK/EbsC (Cys-tRNA(Pro) deacylase) n=1 Tax=Arthrobacter stackebrandtii TaxID=272161 RepID=A0ABS4Z0K5_9MICC|nr:YbaK/EbsC family protein [Arthrobacter stackebrandtii]MBP2414587.1 prolyl-tRNA editing enzyme YbaK/EbsC (Cys-tRNA(Pro) deacylase) [Arthrobacter stackebrandtii]